MAPSMAGQYTARICWNSKGWRFPTGEGAHCESGSFVAEMGFGHEEWLFNFGWRIDGFHYAFLQPVHRSFQSLTGKTIDLYLYTIRPDRTRLYAGVISNCEVLRCEQAEYAFSIYKQRGLLESMMKQVAPFLRKNYRILDLEPWDVLNIRFLPSDADPYDPLTTAPRSDAVWKRSRYSLGPLSQQIEKQWRTRKGTTMPPLINTVNRKGTPAVIYDPVHRRLQKDLFLALQGRYGKGNVVLEDDYVDITIKDNDRTILIEIKTASTCRAAVREAIGQLLEYAYYKPLSGTGELDLIIVAPAEPDATIEKYALRLREQFKIPIKYCSYSEGDPLPAVFEDHSK